MTALPTQPIRVLLIEDHAVVRAGLRLLIESRHGLVVVGEATTHAEALALAAREQPHIILLDLDLGAESGLDLLPSVLAAAGQARVLVLTGVRDVDEHRQAIRQGAMGLVLKEQAPDVLIKAIEKVHAGEVWLDRATLAHVLNEMVVGAARPASSSAARIATLTQREREVIALVDEGLKEQAPDVLLKAIEKVHAGEVWLDRAMLAHVLNEMVVGAARPASSSAARIATLTQREREVIALVDEGLKNKQISDRLSISETTVRHHLTSIFTKLGIGSRLELVIFSHRHSLGASRRQR